MSLFRKAGKKFEETKQKFTGDEEGYVCEACGTALDEDYEYCPHCGESAVEPIDPPDA